MASIKEAKCILDALGMPPAQCNRMSALTLLALCRLTPNKPWAKAQRSGLAVTKGIMDHARRQYGVDYAPNTRETFRRKVLHQFEQGRIVDRNPFDPDLPTNSPRTHYAISESALEVVRLHGAEGWSGAVADFKRNVGRLSQRYKRERQRRMISVTLPDGNALSLSPGKHNMVQKAIVEEFAPRFAPGATLLYLGDAADKNFHVDQSGLARIGVQIAVGSKLPDVVLHDSKRNWVFLVEAVTSHGPMTDTRVIQLKEMFENSDCGQIYVSAFPDIKEFRRHIGKLAWDTEIWLCSDPDHMIHFNGDRFMGPREGSQS